MIGWNGIGLALIMTQLNAKRFVWLWANAGTISRLRM
jgi:hypothetical protein